MFADLHVTLCIQDQTLQILAMGVPVRVPQKAEFPFPCLHVGGTGFELLLQDADYRLGISQDPM